jgi:integrase
VAGTAWPEIDLGKSIWTIAREKVKYNRSHVVHSWRPAIEVLRSLPRIGDGPGLHHHRPNCHVGLLPRQRRLDAETAKARHRALDLPLASL